MSRRAGLVFLFIVLLASFIDFGPYHDILNPDEVAVYFVSLIKWTPFLWGMDRQGMFLSFVTMPIRDPLWNMLAHDLLHSIIAISIFFSFARYLFGRRWIGTGLLALLLLLTLDGLGDLKAFFTPWNMYGLSMGVGLLGLVVMPRSLIAGFLLSLLSVWSNQAMAILFSAIALMKNLVDVDRSWRERRIEAARAIGSMTVSFLMVDYLRHFYLTAGSGGYAFAKLPEICLGWLVMFRNQFSTPDSGVWIFAGPLILFSGILVYRLTGIPESRNKNAMRMAFAALSAGIGYTILAGATLHANWNRYPPRYLIPAVIIWVVVVSGLINESLPKLDKLKGRIVMGVLALACFVTVGVRFGLPSMSGVKDSIKTAIGKEAQDPIDLKCTHIVGEYYRVWNAAFYAWLTTDLRPYAVSERSENAQELWDVRKHPEARVCLWKNDRNEAIRQFNEFHFPPLKPAGESEKMLVLSP